MRNVSLAPLHKKHAAKIPNLLIAVNAGATHWQPNLRKLGGGWGLRAAEESHSPLRFEMPACRTSRVRPGNAL
jgi:hypothetical protein